MKQFLIFICTVWGVLPTFAQDTFSIVALDSITGEVGSAGASCVDLTFFPSFGDDFLGELFPGQGAINSQASYSASNQDNARDRFNMGDSPAEIIAWLEANDVGDNPAIRQYGVVRLTGGSSSAAAYSGTETAAYSNHIVGPNYAIQGNIILGQEILDSMEARFLREEGDLACKLMAAMQGANVVGADTRCAPNGTSSLFAFLKVAQPTDEFGAPSFLVSVRTEDGDEIEPIDSLQTLFDAEYDCGTANIPKKTEESPFVVYSDSKLKVLYISVKDDINYQLEIVNSSGQLIQTVNGTGKREVNIATLMNGVYLARIFTNETVYVSRFVVE